MSELKGQLDEFVGEAHEPADYDRDTGEALEAKPKRRPRSDKGKSHSKHVDAFSTGQPAPGEERASVNLRHWSALVSTNPDYTKPFTRARGFRGTSISPTWREMRMTEHFGPCGIGWGTEKPEYELVPIAGNGELLVYCTVGLWYLEDGRRSATVYGIGGDKVIVKQSNGLHTNDEAYKAAYTDALGNAMKRLGVAGDIHLGLFDDDKYQAEMRAAFAEATTATSPFDKNSGGQQHSGPSTGSGGEQQPTAGPTPDHVKLVLREAARVKDELSKEHQLAWFERLMPEDQRILMTAKQRRRRASELEQ